MLAPDEKLKLSPKPYLAATARFASGTDTPRDFLERCLAELAALEPKIGAFVHLNLEGARVAADQATARWRDGKPLSPIDGMPIGIKDIIETIDMPTEKGSPLFAGCRTERDAASVVALREAGAVIVGKTVTTEFAATEPRGTRNPHDLRRTPGGSSSGSAAAVAAGMLSTALGTQVIGSTIRPGELLRLHRLQADGRRAQPRRQLRWPEPKLHRRAGGHARGRLAGRLRDRHARRRRSRLSGLFGPASAPAAEKPRRLAFLETAGWTDASAGAKQAMADALARLKAAGIDVLHAPIRCQSGGGRGRDRTGAAALDADQRLGIALAAQHLPRARCQQDQPRHARAARRGRSHERSTITATTSRSASRRARSTRGSRRIATPASASPRPPPRRSASNPTGNPNCTVHASLLGIPAISLPVLQDARAAARPAGDRLRPRRRRDLRGGCLDQGFVLKSADG